MKKKTKIKDSHQKKMKGLKNKSLTHVYEWYGESKGRVSLLKPSFREVLRFWPLKQIRNFTFFFVWALRGFFLFYPPPPAPPGYDVFFEGTFFSLMAVTLVQKVTKFSQYFEGRIEGHPCPAFSVKSTYGFQGGKT